MVSVDHCIAEGVIQEEKRQQLYELEENLKRIKFFKMKKEKREKRN